MIFKSTSFYCSACHQRVNSLWLHQPGKKHVPHVRYLKLIHYIHITWELWLFKSLAAVFVQQLVKTINKWYIKVLHYWPFVRGIHQSLVDSPHKGPVMQMEFLWHEAHMFMSYTLQVWPPGSCPLHFTGQVGEGAIEVLPEAIQYTWCVLPVNKFS